LKELAKRGMIEARGEGRNKVYRLTTEGEASLSKALGYFREAFGEIFMATVAGSRPSKRR
jgi:predicted transcriptional regulator